MTKSWLIEIKKELTIMVESKVDVATAIMDKKKAPHKLQVEESK